MIDLFLFLYLCSQVRLQFIEKCSTLRLSKSVSYALKCFVDLLTMTAYLGVVVVLFCPVACSSSLYSSLQPPRQTRAQPRDISDGEYAHAQGKEQWNNGAEDFGDGFVESV